MTDSFKPSNLRPLHDRVIVRRMDAENEINGIILPEVALEKPDIGEVIAIGSGKLMDDGIRVPLTVKVGDTIMFGKYAGQTTRLNDQEYVVLREDDVMAIVE